MKTKDNVQKTIANSMAILFSLILLSITVHAQSFWETVFENSFIQPIALAMVDEKETDKIQTPAIGTSEIVAFLFEVETKEDLKVESWMVNDEIFEVRCFTAESEKPLELEEWMSNDNYFRIAVLDSLPEKEEGLAIENWMIDNKIWK